jgi:peptidoglycan/xylan/chitin deacetylase (PgdA/CDA1 family)
MKLPRSVIINTCIILILFLSSCDICPCYKGPGALILTFDDKYVDEWYKADSILSIYDWKATFCVTAYPTLTKNEKQKLMTLQNNGHEIASHGTKHYNALEYLSNNPMEEYIKEEILPSLNKMQKDGLNITSFAYPGGVRSVEIDLALFDYFSVLRGTTYNKISSKSKSHYFIRGENELLVCGLGIDNHYEHFDIDYIISLLEYAAHEGIAVIFYGHEIADDDISSYVTSYNTLDKICKYAQENGMEFLTLRELTDFNIN